MLVKITLVVAMCGGMNFQTVQSKLRAVQAANPNAQVSVRLDKKAKCANGQVLTGKDAKLFEALK